jgi:cytochrome P450
MMSAARVADSRLLSESVMSLGRCTTGIRFPVSSWGDVGADPRGGEYALVTMMSTFDPTDPGFISNPYPVLNALREEGRIFYDERSNLHLVTRFEDVKAGLRDRRLGRVHDHIAPREPFGFAQRDERWAAFWNVERWSLLELEPPDHTRLRNLITHAFTVRTVERLREPAQRLADDLLAPLAGTGSINLLADFAQPFSGGLIASLLGVPRRDVPQLIEWSHRMVKMYELSTSDEQAHSASRAAAEFDAYVREFVRVRALDPQDDLISSLVRAEVDGQHLSEQELVSTVIVLLNAGHEATVNTMGNGIVAFMNHPHEWATVVAGSVPARVAIEEMIRWDAPLHLFERWVLEDGVEVAGKRLEIGEKVGFLFGSANRDPRRFPRPDEFVAARGDMHHIGFGGGIHRCIGAPLARLEIEVGLEALVRHFPSMKLLETPNRHPTFVIRGYEEVIIGG